VEELAVNRLCVLFGLFVMGLAVLVSGGYGQDTKKDGQPAPKVKLPDPLTKLKIPADQKKKIYDVLISYQAKMAVLKDQMEKLKSEEYAEAYKLLTDEQKDTLKKILAEKADPTKDDKKKF
jgi:hypothetical protein